MLRAFHLALIPLVFTLAAPLEAVAAVTISLEGDSTLTVAAVGWHSIDFVTVVFDDAIAQFIGVQEIRKIFDETGKDRTRDVLEERKVVGTLPAGYDGELAHRGRFTIGHAIFLGIALTGLIFAIFAAGMSDFGY